MVKYVLFRVFKVGVVIFVGNMSGYGKIIIIKYDNGYEIRYVYLSVILINVGEYVNKGDLIGKIGNLGCIIGVYLYFEIRYNGVLKNFMKYL